MYPVYNVSALERDAETWVMEEMYIWPICSVADFIHFLEQNPEYAWVRGLWVIFSSSIHLTPTAWESRRLVHKCVLSLLSTSPALLLITPSSLNHSNSFCWVSCLYIKPANQPSSTPIRGFPFVLRCEVQTPYHGLSPVTMCSPSSMSLYML